MLNAQTSALLADAMVSPADYRVLRRLDVHRHLAVDEAATDTTVGIVIDVETTGLDVARCSIIELSLRRFRFDGFGRITKLDAAHTWREDPGVSLDPHVATLTRFSDADLRDQKIDDRKAVALIASADLRIAFNARFDRPIIERRLPAIAGLPWACAMREIDWRARGFDGSGRSLSWLLAQAGYFHCAHRATADVDATLALLDHRICDGTTALKELLDTARTPTWRFRAIGADYAVKDSLKARGYQWDADERVWSRDVRGADREAEDAWLAEHVYAPERLSRVDRPSVREITWETRHG